MKAVLITGCSSGFGLETARYFHDRDWNVIATMRMPREDLLPRSARMTILPLDVTDALSIDRAVAKAGQIDVLVNNAGIGLLAPFESTRMETVREVFETNTFGTMAVTQAILPQFRERKHGVIINVTSSVTLRPLPLLAVYTATKAAITAFTESLAVEIEQFNVRVALVVPGQSPETQFAANAQVRMQGTVVDAYAGLVQRIRGSIGTSPELTRAQDVAEAIWRAANDESSPMRIPAGADAVRGMGYRSGQLDKRIIVFAQSAEGTDK